MQNEDGYNEVCAGGRSCDVPSGSYVVINHSTGQRFEGITVTQGQSSGIGSSGSNSTLSVSGNIINWPNDGWYQVQRADNYAEVCAGGSSCAVSPGLYNIINHTTGIRYEGISVGGDSSNLTFDEKLVRFEERANTAANAALLEFNQRYRSGTLLSDLVGCIPMQYEGLSIAPVADCNTENLLGRNDIPVSQFAYQVQSRSTAHVKFEDNAAACREALSLDTSDACSLSSVDLAKQGLFMQYGSGERTHTANRSIIISNDSLDLSGLVMSESFGQDACFIEINDAAEWTLLYSSNMSQCEQRLDEALTLLNQ